jgi:hypothetical protein
MAARIARNCLRVSLGLDVRPLIRLSIGQPPPDCAFDRSLGVVNAKCYPIGTSKIILG